MVVLVTDKVKSALAMVRGQWTTPAQGRYVPYKEVAGFSLGKFGHNMALALVRQISMTGNNLIIGQALHVDPIHLQVLGSLGTPLGFLFTLIRSYWIDNTHSREGKFRPFMKYHGIPTLLCAAAVVWFPFHLLPNGGEAISGAAWGSGYWMKVAILWMLTTVMGFFNPLYNLGFDSMTMVISPNSQERLDIQVIVTAIASVSLSVYDTCFYMLSGFFANSLADIRLYRYAYVPVSFVGLALGYFAYFSTKERIVQGRAHVNRMPVPDAFREVGKNRNYWVLFAAGWAGFLEGNSDELIRWSYVYQKKMTPGQYTFADMLIRTAALFSFGAIPPLSRKYSKRTLLLGGNLLNIALLAAILGTYRSMPALVAFRFIDFFIRVVQGQIQDAINADVRDAQHFLTGERIDGMFDLVGSYAGSLIGTATGFVTPWLWRKNGIFEGNGAVDFEGNKSMWFALRDPGTYERMSRTMILSSLVGATANVIPMFFYNLTEEKQRGMTKVLKLRAMFEDYAGGLLKDELRDECAGFVLQAMEGEGPSEENQFVLDELGKYDLPEMQPRLALAREIADGGYEGIRRFDPARVKLARSKEERRVLKDMSAARSKMERFYPEADPAEPDLRALDALYDTRPRSRQEARDLHTQIKAIEAQRSVYYQCTKPYVKAKQLLDDRDHAARLDEIFKAPFACEGGGPQGRGEL